MQDVTIVLVVKQPLLRDGVRSLLEREPGFQVQHQFDSVAAVAVAQPPRVAVFDVGVPTARSLDDVRLLATRLPGSRLVGLSRCLHRRQCDSLREAGLRAWLVDGSQASELPRAILAAARDEPWKPPVLPETTLELSPREEEVLRLLAEGLTSKEMATRLDVARLAVFARTCTKPRASWPQLRCLLTSAWCLGWARHGLVETTPVHREANPLPRQGDALRGT